VDRGVMSLDDPVLVCGAPGRCLGRRTSLVLTPPSPVSCPGTTILWAYQKETYCCACGKELGPIRILAGVLPLPLLLQRQCLFRRAVNPLMRRKQLSNVFVVQGRGRRGPRGGRLQAQMAGDTTPLSGSAGEDATLQVRGKVCA
jgi:hypothetical protein